MSSGPQVRITVQKLPLSRGEQYSCMYENVEVSATATVNGVITCAPLRTDQLPTLPRNQGIQYRFK